MATKEKKAVQQPREICGLPRSVKRDLPSDIEPRRESLIRIIGKTWSNGTQIHYCFWDSSKHNSHVSWDGSTQDKKVVRDSWKAWKKIGIGLEFIEVSEPSEAEVRIGFQQNGGSWSYVGTDVLGIPMNERTMNFGWQLHGDPYGPSTALHEIGHTLGLPHEHQNPKAGIQWNESNVYAEFSGHPNYWDRDKIHWNILRKIPINEVDGSDWDPKSIMHYSFGSGLIDAPAPYSNSGIPVSFSLSKKDKGFIKKFYPLLNKNKYTELKPYKSQHAELQPGDQMDFIIKPRRTRRYSMQTLGRIDTLLTLFEKNGNSNRYLDGDDDAGFGRNAKVRYKLLRGREYILRVRFYYGSETGDTLVVLF